MGVLDAKHVKERVERLLFHYLPARDSDRSLIATIWYKEYKDKGLATPEELKAVDRFLRVFAAGDITNPETIRRIRQKLQQDNPSLRGERYKERKDLEVKAKQEVLGL